MLSLVQHIRGFGCGVAVMIFEALTTFFLLLFEFAVHENKSYQVDNRALHE